MARQKTSKVRSLTGMESFLIIGLIPFLFITGTLAGQAVHLSVAIIGFAVCILLYTRHKNIEITYRKNEKIVIVVLSVLFIIMISIFDILNSGFLDIDILADRYSPAVARIIWIWGYIIYLPSIVMASYIVVGTIVRVALENKPPGGYNKNTYKLCLGIISVSSICYLFSTYPGIWIQDDVASVWGWVSEGKWDTWHTLGYELFVALCSIFVKSSYTVNIVQTILWILLNAYVLKVLQEESSRGMKIYTVVLIFVATPLNYLEVMYKDVVFSMGILAITVGIYHVVKNKRMIWQDVLAFAIGGMFASVCRHAGNVAVILALTLALIYFLVKKLKYVWQYFIGIIVFQVFAFLFVNVMLMHTLNAVETPPYVKYTMPMVTIGASVHRGVEFEEEDIKVLEKVMPVEDWGTCYDKYWADNISRNWGRIGSRINTVNTLIDTEQYGRDLLKINLKLLVHHPYIYLSSIFDMNNIIWKMATPNDGYEWALCRVNINEDITYRMLFTYTNQWTRFASSVPLTNAMSQRGGVALFVIMLSCAVWVLQKKHHFLIVLVPIIVYNCMLLITIPSQDPRFILPGMECAIFIVAVIFGTNEEKIDNIR